MADVGATTVIESYPCTICGCTCDDIRLTTENERVIAAENACTLGVAGLTAIWQQPRAEAWIEGKPATMVAAIDRALEILQVARSPLIYAGVDSPVESQRLTVQIAQRIRGILDSPAFAASPIFPEIGTAACSLGEAKNRADLIVLWNCDPAATHPRLFTHFLLDPTGRFLPLGRPDRTLVVVGNPKLANSMAADEAIDSSPGDDFENLWHLRSLVRDQLAGASDWQKLAERMRAARFGVLVVDESVGPRAIEAAYGLAMALQSTTRFYVIVLRRGGNAAGMQNVVTWLSGAPGPVSFRSPEKNKWGDEFCANRLLSRSAVDVAVLIGGGPWVGLNAQSEVKLSQIPQIIVSSQAASFAQSASVAIPVAPFPISSQGTVFRMDGVALPLPLAIPASVPDEFAVLSQLVARLPPT